MFLNVQHSDLQPGASSETSMFTNAQLTLLMKKKTQQMLQFTFRRMVNARRQTDDKTQLRRRLHHLANRYVVKTEQLGRTLRVIHTGSQNQRHLNAPTSGKRSIEWALRMEETGKDFTLDIAQQCPTFMVRCLRIVNGTPNRVPREMFLHLS